MCVYKREEWNEIADIILSFVYILFHNFPYFVPQFTPGVTFFYNLLSTEIMQYSTLSYNIIHKYVYIYIYEEIEPASGI